METPFLGPDYRARSKNLADQKLVNLYPEVVDSKTGKAVAGLYGTPGLTVPANFPRLGSGPVRGIYAQQIGNLIGAGVYGVGGAGVYNISFTGGVATLIGNLTTSSGPVYWIDNGAQVAVFDGVGGYIVNPGFPLAPSSFTGGTGYAIGDVIVLVATNNFQVATAQLTVLTLSGSAVATYAITTTGLFVEAQGTSIAPVALALVQASTTGNGSGFAITSAAVGGLVTLYPIALPFAGPAGPTSYQDGFGVVIVQESDLVYQSNLFDLSIWDPLNFSNVSSKPTNLVSVTNLHKQMFFLKETNGEIWINAGLNGFVFQPLEGVYMEVGCAAPATATLCGESIVWLAKNVEGLGVVVRVTGYEPVRISDHALEYAIAQYSTISDAIGFSYQMEGHVFYVLIFPSGNATWVIDLTDTAKLGVPLWHQWAAFDSTEVPNLNRHYANCFVSYTGLDSAGGGTQQIVGDYRNGNLYQLDLDAYTDNGQPIKRVRSWRALAKPAFQPVRFSNLVINIETGAADEGQTLDPQLVLRYSDDGGHTWSNEIFESAGAVGETDAWVRFNRLGSTRRGGAMDRIFELSTTDPFKIAWIGAQINV